MLASPALVQEITRKGNCFLRKNINYRFTADPFSATNVPCTSDAGFAGRRATAVQASRGAKAAPGSVAVLRKSLARKVQKEGGRGRRSLGFAFAEKSLPSAQATGFASAALTRRGAKLHAATLRATRLAAQSK